MPRKRRRRRRRAPRIRRLTSPGTVPGTLHVREESQRPVIRIIRFFDNEIFEERLEDVSQAAGYLSESAVTWVNVDGLGDARTLEQFGEVFGLHRLALEDVVNVHQSAKVEEYGDHLFIVLRMVTIAEHVESEQLSMFLGRNFVLTFQERAGDCLDPVRERLRQSRGRIRQSGADYLAYALIDAVMDAYFPVVDEYAERLEQLDGQLAVGHTPNFMDVLHDVRGDLMTLRRAIRPLRDALVRLMPDPHSLISEPTQFYFRDCYDHSIQLMDLLDSYREMCADLREYYLSSVNTRMNEAMKVLTMIATIFIPLSFIAGVYGMNFNTELPGNMPELNWPFGYVFALSLMGTVAVGFSVFIWRKGWLSSGNEVIQPPNPSDSIAKHPARN